MEKYIENFDIICLSETKTDSIDSDSLIEYRAFCKTKLNKRLQYGGYYGIAVLVKKTIAVYFKVIENVVSDSVLWLKVDGNAFGIDIVIGAVYIPHEGSKYHNNSIYDNIAEDYINIKAMYDVPIILMGDYNSRTGNLDDVDVMDTRVKKLPKYRNRR